MVIVCQAQMIEKNTQMKLYVFWCENIHIFAW